MKQKDKALKKVFIITGASGGLGRALVERLASERAVLFLITRRKAADIISAAADKGGYAKNIICDLTEARRLEGLMRGIFRNIDLKKTEAVILINNAGSIYPVSFAGNAPGKDVIDNLNVNCVAPVILSNAFIERTGSFKGPKLIVNISSGAANEPIEGWSCYCAGKAGLEMFSRSAAKEQSRYKSGVRICAIDPGAVDTKMQSRIRRSSKKDFPDVGKFIRFHKSGLLIRPETAAKKVADLICGKLAGNS